MTPCGALRASSPSSTAVTTSSIWSWILLFHFCLRFGRGDAFCTDRFLQTDDVTHRSLYTEQLLPADILTQRGLCTKKHLCTDAFAHRGFTQKRKNLHTDALYKDAFAHIKGTQAFLHTEPFPQRSLCTEQFLHMFFLHKKTFDTEKLAHTDCTQKFSQTDFFARRTLLRTVFTQQKLFRTETFTHNKHMHNSFCRQTVFTQKVLRTEVLRTESFTHNIFYIQMLLHTDVFAQTQIAHRSLCTQHAFTHTALLDHLPFVFPLSSLFQGEETFQPGLAVRLRLSGARKSWLWQWCITMMNLRYLGKAAKLLLFILRQLRPCWARHAGHHCKELRALSTGHWCSWSSSRAFFDMEVS